jgi:hypothetical protein
VRIISSAACRFSTEANVCGIQGRKISVSELLGLFEYWEHSRFCAKLIVEQAGFDVVKLASLVDNYHHLPSPASTTLRGKLLSDHCLDLSEQDRPMTTQLSEICDVGQLIYTMHPTAAYDPAQIGLNNDQIEVYLSML